MTAFATETVHATCVALGEHGVLLSGPSGCGKSDLAARLIDGGGQLVADDQVIASRRDQRIWAAAPAQTAGLLELRGAGLITLPYLKGAFLHLVVDLIQECPERLPDPATRVILGVALPLYGLRAFEASAPAKIRFILHSLANRAIRSDLSGP